MTDVKNLAAYILERLDHAPTTMELEKLAYYSQAWHLTWVGTLLTESEFQAWRDGPVSWDLYDTHRGARWVSKIHGGHADELTGVQRSVVDAVVAFYGAMSPEDLSNLTHREEPWLEARAGLPASASSDRPISTATMRRFHTSQIVQLESVPTAPPVSVLEGHEDDHESVLEESRRQRRRWSHTLAWLADR